MAMASVSTRTLPGAGRSMDTTFHHDLPRRALGEQKGTQRECVLERAKRASFQDR